MNLDGVGQSGNFQQSGAEEKGGCLEAFSHIIDCICDFFNSIAAFFSQLGQTAHSDTPITAQKGGGEGGEKVNKVALSLLQPDSDSEEENFSRGPSLDSEESGSPPLDDYSGESDQSSLGESEGSNAASMSSRGESDDGDLLADDLDGSEASAGEVDAIEFVEDEASVSTPRSEFIPYAEGGGVPKSTSYTFTHNRVELGKERDETHRAITSHYNISTKKAEVLKDKSLKALAKEQKSHPLLASGVQLLQKSPPAIEEMESWMEGAKKELSSCEKAKELPPHYAHLKSCLEIVRLDFQAAQAKRYLDGKVDHTVEDLVASDPRAIDWIGSQFSRDIFHQAKKLQGEEFRETYSKLAERVLQAPVNFRSHVAEADGEVKIFERLGVIADATNAYTDLGEMERAAKSDKYRVKVLERLKKREKLAKSDKEKIVIQRAIDQYSSPAAIERAREEREALLDLQMLQLVAQQMQNKKGNCPHGTFKMMHLLLLTESNKKWDETNCWYKDEGHFMGDMGAIFKRYQGAEIRFEEGLEAPYTENVGKKKVIHLPKLEKSPERAELKSAFVNVAVQLNKKGREKRQLKLFRDFYETISKEVAAHSADEKKIEAFEERFNEGGTNFQLGLDLIHHYGIDLDEWAISLGCMSAKDRTGVLAELVASAFILSVKRRKMQEACRSYRSPAHAGGNVTRRTFKQAMSEIKREIKAEKDQAIKREKQEILEIYKKAGNFEGMEECIDDKLEEIAAEWAKGIFSKERPALAIAQQCCNASREEKQRSLKTCTVDIPYLGTLKITGQMFKVGFKLPELPKFISRRAKRKQ